MIIIFLTIITKTITIIIMIVMIVMKMIAKNKINKNNHPNMNLMMNKDHNYIVNNRYYKTYYLNRRKWINRICRNIQIYTLSWVLKNMQ